MTKVAHTLAILFPNPNEKEMTRSLSGMSHIKISSLGIKAAGDNSLNKNNLLTYNSWSSYKDWMLSRGLGDVVQEDLREQKL